MVFFNPFIDHLPTDHPTIGHQKQLIIDGSFQLREDFVPLSGGMDTEPGG